MRIFLCLIVTLLAIAPGASAQGTASTSTASPSGKQPANSPSQKSEPEAPSHAEGTLRLAVDLDPSLGVDAEQLRERWHKELGHAFTTNGAEVDGHLWIQRQAQTEVVVRYQLHNNPELVRSVSLPERVTERSDVLFWLVSNLVSDQTSGLLAELAPRASAPSPTEGASTEAQAQLPQPLAPPNGASAPVPSRTSDKLQQAPLPKSPGRPAALPPLEPINLSLFHPITLIPNAEAKRFHFELGLGYSRLYGITGFGLTAGALRVDGPSEGLLVAGLYAQWSGPLRGLVSSGLVSYASGPLEGMVGSGAVNILRGDATGAVAAGLVNVVQGDATGLVAAALVNVVQGDATGLVAAALVNVVQGDATGLVPAGAVNSNGKVFGLQAAGGVNLASSVEGAQVGTVNLGGDVRGVQIGLVNISEKMTGVPIGFVNIVTTGRHQAQSWVTLQDTHDGYRSSLAFGYKNLREPLYTLVSLGLASPLEAKRSDAVPGAEPVFATASSGLGVEVGPEPLYLAADLQYFIEANTEKSETPRHGVEGRASLGLDFGSVGAFAGVGARQAFEQAEVELAPEVFAGLSLF